MLAFFELVLVAFAVVVQLFHESLFFLRLQLDVYLQEVAEFYDF